MRQSTASTQMRHTHCTFGHSSEASCNYLGIVQDDQVMSAVCNHISVTPVKGTHDAVATGADMLL